MSGATWFEIDLPSTNENGVVVGTNPGSQGRIHFSLEAHPTDANLIFVGGDRQPLRNLGGGGGPAFPNSIGANGFTGRLFRGDVSERRGSQFVHLTHSAAHGAVGGGTVSNSAPHRFSRELAFDANSQLIEASDGGLYRRNSPSDNSGDWFSLNGNLQVAEVHSVAYDPLNNRLVAGTGSAGTSIQGSGLGNATWESVSGGYGGHVAVDASSQPRTSIVYSSFSGLGAFRKRTYDPNGTLVDESFPALTPLDGDPRIAGQFFTPLALNSVDSNRLAFGGTNGVYESLDQGETVSLVSPLRASALVYGGESVGTANSEMLIFGAGNQIYARTMGDGDVSIMPGYSGNDVRDLVARSNDYRSVFAIDGECVYFSSNAGDTFADITGDLASSELRSIEYVDLPGRSIDAVLVGGQDGVFLGFTDALGEWEELGATTLPNAPVLDLLYNIEDDVLVAGTLGRGVWTVSGLSTFLIPEPNSLELMLVLASLVLSLAGQRAPRDIWRRSQSNDDNHVLASLRAIPRS